MLGCNQLIFWFMSAALTPQFKFKSPTILGLKIDVLTKADMWLSDFSLNFWFKENKIQKLDN